MPLPLPLPCRSRPVQGLPYSCNYLSILVCILILAPRIGSSRDMLPVIYHPVQTETQIHTQTQTQTQTQTLAHSDPRQGQRQRPLHDGSWIDDGYRDDGDDGDDDEDDLLAGADFKGLLTYANLPYVKCMSVTTNSGSDGPGAHGHGGLEGESQRYDIAILGAPFDTGTTARPGARFGPQGIRWGSRRIQPDFAWSIYTGENTLLSWAKIVDCGDAPLTFLDNSYALKQLGKAHEVVSGRKANATAKSNIPRIITLGGDHTTTLAALRSTYQRWGGEVSVIHFDSHLDTWDPKVLGGGLSHYAGVNHGTFLHLAHEEGLITNRSIHAGIRAPVFNRHHDLNNDARCGFSIVTAREIDHIGIGGIISRLKARVGENKVYISVDIDVLDPAYAPATGTAEVGGWTTRELLSILDGLEGMKVVGADVVEVAPAYDNAGETTGLAAAEVVHSLTTLMVKTPVKE